ncbi:AAEL008551-PA [Aedes aegypti]|uniref:C2H2-type domain-containing protein n=2 Tax=Aedes aegypti TaxID=7159 RepID=Q16YJ2_AEDAE|nr:transcription factor grauzone [Aedes aegypti]EAT39664.1 AAEL008551-PA [Aedes aegypti]
MPPICLTCTRGTAPNESIPIGSSGAAHSALAKHFWFNEDESSNAVLCQLCWGKIDEFHQFYCEIEKIHSQGSGHPIQMLEIKQEQEVVESLSAEIKNESEEVEDKGTKESKVEEMDDEVTKDENSEESDRDCPSDKDNESEQEKVVRKKSVRKKPTTLRADILAKVDKYAAKHVTLECSFCAVKFPTFDRLQTHSKKAHKKQTTVLCCGKKFCQRGRFYDHIQVHLNPNQFQCDQCDKRCPSSEALKSHVDIKHAAEKTFQCESCPKKFALKSLVVAHRKRCHSEAQNDSASNDIEEGDETDADEAKKAIKDEAFILANISLECHVCSVKHSSYQDFLKHSQAAHGVHAAVYCCGHKFTRKPRIIDHILYHQDPSQFRCDICPKQFKHSLAFSRHMGMRHVQEEAKTFQCSMCPKAFSRKQFLHVHEKYHRKMSEKNFQCAHCDKFYAFESMLKQHERLVHTKECHFVCHICARGFQALSSYSSHLASHDEEAKKDKPPEERLQCSVCSIWVYKQNYRKHVLLHSGTQTCDICGQECKNVMALRYHKAQHRRGDCSCSVCGKTFKRKFSLKEHMASHTGETLYQCDFCDRTFNSSANRASHRKKRHPKEWLEDKLRKNPNLLKDGQLTAAAGEQDGDSFM